MEKHKKKITRREFIISGLGVISLLSVIGASSLFYYKNDILNIEKQIYEKEIEVIIKALELLKLIPKKHRGNFLKEIKSIVRKRLNEWKDKELDKNIDEFLDWYFSLEGDYIMAIVSLVKGVADVADIEKLQKLSMDIENKILGILTRNFDKCIEKINDDTIQVFEKYTEKTIKEIEEKAKNVPDLKLSTYNQLINEITARAYYHQILSFSLSVSIYIKPFRKVVRSFMLRLAERIVETVSKRTTSRLVSSVVTSLGGLACGPFAVPCSIAAFISTWVLSDYAFIKIDEFFKREKLFKEIKKELNVYIDEKINKPIEDKIHQYASQMYSSMENEIANTVDEYENKIKKHPIDYIQFKTRTGKTA